ncbi:MAG: MBOAT family protein [Oscillospiraceae bacterium]|nr:MBOAT family protein [Oscillospiraceae bacterium]
MLFSTHIFIFAFLPCVLIGYYGLLRKSRRGQNIFLTAASLFFYAWGEPWFVFVMIGSILCNWAFALWVDAFREKAKHIVAVMVIFNLGIMFVFKYLTFTLENINGIVGGGLKIPIIDLPIGISFFTFQAMSYVFDVYRKRGEAQNNPLNVALYISLFPQLIAGPIVRYETIADQIHNRRETIDDFSSGVCLFVTGLAKKVLIANSLAFTADMVFDMGERTAGLAWLGIAAYTFQIYYDFSGYSDMAIGLGRMFGFHFLPNFNYPYISRSITEFWRRWHISLGAWFRDYLYFPLGGSRVKSKRRLILNLFVVWLLTGIWHGANWTFILWGLMYFAIICAEKLTGIDKLVLKSKLASAFGHIYTLFFVMMGWVLFRSESIFDAAYYIRDMFAIGTAAGGSPANISAGGSAAWFWLRENIYFFIAAAVFSTPIAKRAGALAEKYKPLRVIYPVMMLVLFLITISYVVKDTYNPFIYFNF